MYLQTTNHPPVHVSTCTPYDVTGTATATVCRTCIPCYVYTSIPTPLAGVCGYSLVAVHQAQESPVEAGVTGLTNTTTTLDYLHHFNEDLGLLQWKADRGRVGGSRDASLPLLYICVAFSPTQAVWTLTAPLPVQS